MKLLVEFDLDESWESYIPDNNEKLKALIKSQLEGVKAKVVENLDLQCVSFPFNSTVERWRKLAETLNGTIITHQRMLDTVIKYNHNSKQFLDDIKKMHKEL